MLGRPLVGLAVGVHTARGEPRDSGTDEEVRVVHSAYDASQRQRGELNFGAAPVAVGVVEQVAGGSVVEDVVVVIGRVAAGADPEIPSVECRVGSDRAE